VVLTNGDGGSRHSYRNRYLAGRLRLAGYATLRVDLLTAEERRAGREMAMACDLPRITERLTSACEWVARARVRGAHRTILIGASTGAAAALATAARRPAHVHAVVARAGRVELAADVLPHVLAPVLLIVGATDRDAIRRNGEAMRELPRGALLIRIPRASHAFTEPGALGAVAEQTVRWLDHLDRRWREDGSGHA
jgi:dienelactone hydrolase